MSRSRMCLMRSLTGNKSVRFTTFCEARAMHPQVSLPGPKGSNARPTDKARS
jgi:hypothetical protein